MNAHTREATLADVRYVAANLRAADRAEMLAHGRTDAFEALLEGFHLSDPCQVMVDREGNPFGLFGAVPHPQNPWSAAVWMLATDSLETEALAFARGSRKVVDGWLAKYEHLFNWVDSRNTVHVRWLEWLGFIFLSKTRTPTGVTLIEFCKVRNHV